MYKHSLHLAVLIFASSCASQKIVTDQEIDLYCQRLNVLHHKLAAITSNIANVKTTRMSAGGSYRRQIVSNCVNGFCKDSVDDRAFILKYEPKHPDANKDGYVAYPNVYLEEEQADMKKWEYVFENVVQYAPVNNKFFLDDPRAKICFDKYPFVDERYNFQKYL